MTWGLTTFIWKSRWRKCKRHSEAIGLVILVFCLLAGLAYYANSRGHNSPIGTFAFIKVFGFSINSLTLFGIILATGLVVDDAIVVVEQIARMIQEEGCRRARLPLRECASCLGRLPCQLCLWQCSPSLSRCYTEIYKQFGLTIAFSIAISTFLALTLAPSLRPTAAAKTRGTT